MPGLELHYDRLLSWLGPVAVAGFLAACGGGEKAPAGGADAPSGAPSTPPPAAETQGSADAPPATGAAQAPAKAPADSPPRSPAASAAPAAPAGEAAGGGGPNDPKSIALGDSIFHGQAGGGTCYACHGQDGKGSAVGSNLTDAEWLHSDGSLQAIEKTIQTGVPKPTKAPAPMPPMGGASLTPEQVKAAAAYVYSLSHGDGRN
jgi:hypothetical protein